MIFTMMQTIMRGLLPPDKQHQAEDRALEDAEEEAEMFETEVLLIFFMFDNDDHYDNGGPHTR